MDSLSATGLGATATTTSTASLSKDKLNTDYESFLKLLIAQVSHQDPLEPMDSTTFVSQLAQLTQVEQSIVTNDTLEKISNRMNSNGAMSDVMLIGRDVTVPTDRVELQDGVASFSYQLSGEAQQVKALIRGQDGTVLREITNLGTEAGTPQSVGWDGKDPYGLPVPNGAYKIEILAIDAEGEPVSASTQASTRVEQLTFRDGLPVLVLRNGGEAYSGSVLSVM